MCILGREILQPKVEERKMVILKPEGEQKSSYDNMHLQIQYIHPNLTKFV